MKNILINADDFGFTENTDKGIIETVEFGSVTEVSMIMNSYSFNNALKFAKDNNWKFVGLHITLFDVNKGDKPFRNADYERVLAEFDSKKLCMLIQHEISKFEDSFGFKPHHINAHKQLHFNPKVIDFIFDYASKNNIYVRKWGDFYTSTVIPSDLDFIKAKLKEYQIKTSDKLFGFEYDFENPINVISKYKKLIDETPENSTIEILFHPGYCSDFEKTLTGFIKEREADRILLCSGEFKAFLEQTINK